MFIYLTQYKIAIYTSFEQIHLTRLHLIWPRQSSNSLKHSKHWFSHRENPNHSNDSNKHIYPQSWEFAMGPIGVQAVVNRNESQRVADRAESSVDNFENDRLQNVSESSALRRRNTANKCSQTEQAGPQTERSMGAGEVVDFVLVDIAFVYVDADECGQNTDRTADLEATMEEQSLVLWHSPGDEVVTGEGLDGLCHQQEELENE